MAARALVWVGLLAAVGVGGAAGRVLRTSGARWDLHELWFRGPVLSETGTPNPFTEFHMTVRFTHVATGIKTDVPGFFAADGRAAHTSATTGRVWIARFTPARTGVWTFRVTFLRSRYAAVTGRGAPVAFHGRAGRFVVVEQKAARAPDLRTKGRLQYVGQRYFRYANGQYKLKLGTNTPENLLGYTDFDKERAWARHNFSRHVRDWRPGNPTWGPKKRGKGMIGAINYLSKQGVNSLFAMLMTVKGDSRGDVHPWIAQNAMERFDVSKLEQWQIVFGYASTKGLSLNLAFLETENEALFEHAGGISRTRGFATARKLFYREMVARFSHNLGFTMTLGEENGWSEKAKNGGGHPWGVGNTDLQRAEFTYFIRQVDPYDSPIMVHTVPVEKSEVYPPLLSGASRARVEAASLQMGVVQATHHETAEWLARSVQAGRPWVVTADEFGGGTRKGFGGVPLDSYGVFPSHYRAQFAWGNVLAGGGGMELFSASVDQSLDDFRELERAWGQFSRAVILFERHGIPFWAMNGDDSLVTSLRRRAPRTWTFCLAKRGEVYVVYTGADVLRPRINLGAYPNTRFYIRWFSPRMGERVDLQVGSKSSMMGRQWKGGVGAPPGGAGRGRDWVIVVMRDGKIDTRAKMLRAVSPRDLIPGALTLGRKETWA